MSDAADTSLEWAVQYEVDGNRAFHLCDDLAGALWRQKLYAPPAEIVCRVVTRSAWEVAKQVSS